MRFSARILSIALPALLLALGGCSLFDAWDKVEPSGPGPQVVQNPGEPTKHVDHAEQSKPPKPPKNPQPPPKDALAAGHFKDLMGRALNKVLDAADVTCRLTRTEMINGVLQKQEVLDFQQRFSPQSLKLKWVGEEHKGRVLIYVAGQNDNKVLVKEPGLGGFLLGGKPASLGLDSAVLKSQGRYTPDVVGYNNLVKRIAALFRDARPLGLAWVEEQPSEMVAGRRLQTFQLAFESVLLDVDVKRILITFDVAEALPVHTITYDAKDRLVEDYEWQRLRLNAGLTDADFKFETEK